MSIENNTTGLNNLKELIETLPSPTSGNTATISYGRFYGVNQNSITITHGLGVMPKFIGCYNTEGVTSGAVVALTYDSGRVINGVQVKVYGFDSSGGKEIWGGAPDSAFIEINESIAILKSGYLDATFDNTYLWVAIAELE